MSEHVLGAAGHPSRLEQQKVEATFQHFKREFPDDPVRAFARFFAKSSCRRCYGRGLETVVGPAQAQTQTQTIADLRQCGCGRRRLARFVMKALVFEVALERGGLAFAEGTVCPEAELALPVATPADLPRAS